MIPECLRLLTVELKLSERVSLFHEANGRLVSRYVDIISMRSSDVAYKRFILLNFNSQIQVGTTRIANETYNIKQLYNRYGGCTS